MNNLSEMPEYPRHSSDLVSFQKVARPLRSPAKPAPAETGNEIWFLTLSDLLLLLMIFFVLLLGITLQQQSNSTAPPVQRHKHALPPPPKNNRQTGQSLQISPWAMRPLHWNLIFWVSSLATKGWKESPLRAVLSTLS